MQPHFNDYASSQVDSPTVMPSYVMRLRDELKTEYQGLHTKMTELESIRYLEDKIGLAEHEQLSGLEFRTGLSSDLVEKVKAALTTNLPTVLAKPMREGNSAATNASKRQLFWQGFLKYVSRPNPVLSEAVDAQAGLGMTVLKAVYYPWDKVPTRDKKEKDSEYTNRVRGYKRQVGPPFKIIALHPMTFLGRPGAAGVMEEVIEESYKSKNRVYKTYGIKDDGELLAKTVSALDGQPIGSNVGRSLPIGQSSGTMVKVTEYWTPDIRQVYIEDRFVFEETGDSGVRYFLILGRTTSSKDPDKMGQSVADVLRHIEPMVNRTLTRMAEASDLLVRKRLAIELPEGSTDYLSGTVGDDNNPETRNFNFKPERAEALPPGANIKDPFAGAENVYGALPFIQLLLQIAGQHGVSPIFKGVSPGAGSSGYRDNSLYLMARAQFDYLIENFQSGLSDLITCLENWIVTKVKREVICGEYKLTPSDIENWPVVYSVEVKPFLPQNVLAEGEFYDQMWTKGHVTRRTVRTKGVQLEDPEREDRERMLEDLQSMLRPVLYQDVLRITGIIPPTNPTSPTILGPDGQPISGQNPQAGQSPSSNGTGGAMQSGGAQQAEAARTQAGSPKQPPLNPGELNSASQP